MDLRRGITPQHKTIGQSVNTQEGHAIGAMHIQEKRLWVWLFPRWCRLPWLNNTFEHPKGLDHMNQTHVSTDELNPSDLSCPTSTVHPPWTLTLLWLLPARSRLRSPGANGITTGQRVDHWYCSHIGEVKSSCHVRWTRPLGRSMQFGDDEWLYNQGLHQE